MARAAPATRRDPSDTLIRTGIDLQEWSMHNATARWALAALVPTSLVAGCGESESSKEAATATAPSTAAKAEASATLTTADGEQAGTVELSAAPGGALVDIQLKAAKAVTAGRFHGIHVHANDDPANGEGCQADKAAAASTWFSSADGHLTSGTATHGDHRGDLPSVLVRKDGSASLRFTTDRFTPAEVIGKTVILHAAADNHGNIPTGSLPDQYTANAAAATTKTSGTGNAGDRMACGLISRA